MATRFAAHQVSPALNSSWHDKQSHNKENPPPDIAAKWRQITSVQGNAFQTKPVLYKSGQMGSHQCITSQNKKKSLWADFSTHRDVL
jgi:hypothetical protein